ncbi:radical SAM protein [Actinophytocola oryzae]|uniref:DNA repair photolyase n=1 Tax=Actinophytocola oryzae TaxID=502181 RepID=A0A4R7UTS5_9PSEU|nr:radical SAM protein [Actinophytocola oryzae]TDV36825.1 DNA repair photolyase [Actinophytocola oryzae]
MTSGDSPPDGPRVLGSGLWAGGGACRFDCVYCFASDPTYQPGPSLYEEDFGVDARGGVIQLSYDTELFHNPGPALRALSTLSTRGSDITFATKMNLPESILTRLRELGEDMRTRGNVLSVMVSMPLWSSSERLEHAVAPVHLRVALVGRLRAAGLHPFVGIRPILPEPFLTDSDIGRIIDATVADSHGYILGPYWFRTDRLGLAELDVSLRRAPVPWLDDRPEWWLYEDKAREDAIRERITAAGGRCYARSADVVTAIRKSLAAPG